MSFYYIYVLKSEIDNKLYIGYSEDLLNRVSEHNKKKGGLEPPKTVVH
jgi:predicted GIY-YIG superfamily endonuclease